MVKNVNTIDFLLELTDYAIKHPYSKITLRELRMIFNQIYDEELMNI